MEGNKTSDQQCDVFELECLWFDGQYDQTYFINKTSKVWTCSRSNLLKRVIHASFIDGCLVGVLNLNMVLKFDCFVDLFNEFMKLLIFLLHMLKSNKYLFHWNYFIF
jgi:hypothetical protein